MMSSNVLDVHDNVSLSHSGIEADSESQESHDSKTDSPENTADGSKGASDVQVVLFYFNAVVRLVLVMNTLYANPKVKQ